MFHNAHFTHFVSEKDEIEDGHITQKRVSQLKNRYHISKWLVSRIWRFTSRKKAKSNILKTWEVLEMCIDIRSGMK